MRVAACLLLAACGAPHAAGPDANPFGPAPDAALLDAAAPTHALAGINLAPTQGTSNAGAFQPGVYQWDYTPAQIAAFATSFDIVRVPINVDTANSPAALATLQGYVDQLAGQRALLCLFGTAAPNAANNHGTGVVDDVGAAIAAWQHIDAVFHDYGNVHYELFNEPFGYDKANPAAYLSVMTQLMVGANLPAGRVVIDGMGYADDIQIVAAQGWSGDLGYHFYPNWSATHDQSVYSNLAQAAIGALGPHTWVTEFGADLSDGSNTCYQTFEDANQPTSADVNALRGLDDALRAQRASGNEVKGVVVWHGWDNGDSYDYWLPSNAQGACKVRLIQSVA
jgi:hypothetical protein